MNNGFSSAPNEEGLLDVLQYSNAYTHRPPPRATWYRISCILFVTGFGIPKAILGYNNWVFASVSLDLVFGVVVTILLMVAGWYELDPPKRWRWFFETDWQELYWKPCEGYIERQSPYIQQLFIGFSTLLGLWTVVLVLVGLMKVLIHFVPFLLPTAMLFVYIWIGMAIVISFIFTLVFLFSNV